MQYLKLIWSMGLYKQLGCLPLPTMGADICNPGGCLVLWHSPKVEKIHGGERRAISQLLLGPHAAIVLEVQQTHRNIYRSLGRCWHTCGQTTGTQKPCQVEKIHGGGKRSISQLLLEPHAPNFLEVPETHRNISRPFGRCWCIHEQSTSTQNWAKFSKYLGEWGGQYLSFY